MRDLKIEHVQIRPETLREALKACDDAIQRNQQMKELLQKLQRTQEGGSGRPRGRPKGSGRAAGGGRGRRKAGKTLREAIIDVLSKERGPVKPIDLRDKVMASGYPTSATPQSLYTAVFNTARRESSILKSDEGFYLRGGAASSNGGPARKKTAKRKAAKRKTAKRKTAKRKTKAGS